MELILVRHGTTQGNLEKRFVGTLDVPLLPQGEELARRQFGGITGDLAGFFLQICELSCVLCAALGQALWEVIA